MKFGVQTPIFVTEGKWGHIRKKKISQVSVWRTGRHYEDGLIAISLHESSNIK